MKTLNLLTLTALLLCGCSKAESQLPSNVRIVPVNGQFTFIETNSDPLVQMFAGLYDAATGRYETRQAAVNAAVNYIASCDRLSSIAALKAETAAAIAEAAAKSVKPDSDYVAGYKKGFADGLDGGLTLAYCLLQSQPHFTNYYDFEAQAMQYKSNATAHYSKHTQNNLTK